MKIWCAAVIMTLCSMAVARGDGLSVSLPLVGRVTGAGGVVFATAIDLSNNASTSARIDFYFDAKDLTTGELESIVGSIGDFGLVSPGSGVLAANGSVHFDDFIDALVSANMLSSIVRDDGVQGSVLFVFNGFSKRGQGTATARFYNGFGGGSVGVALTGHEIMAGEPQKLVACVRDTTAADTSGLTYPNIFINNTGLSPDGKTARADVTVQLSAVSAATHKPTGNSVNVVIGAGQTVTVGHVFQALGVTPSADVTALLVTAKVISGAAAIEGLVSQVDVVTKDGSAFEMSRADF